MNLLTQAGVHLVDLAPPPTEMTTNRTATYIATGIQLAALVVALLGAAWVAARQRSPLPALLVVGGLICFFCGEAMFDVLGGTWYPADSPFVIATMLGHPLPLWVMCAWAGSGLGVYLLYRAMLRGISTRSLLSFFAAGVVVEFVFEAVFLESGVYTYYAYTGPNPATVFGLPIQVPFEAGMMALVAAYGLVLATPYLRGWRWLWVVPAAPAIYLGSAWGLNWGVYLAINSPVSSGVMWAAAVLAVVLNVAVAYFVIKAPQLRRLRTRPQPLTAAVGVAVTDTVGSGA